MEGFMLGNQTMTSRPLGVETGSIDQTLKAVEGAGGKVITPKHAIGEWGFMADFADPEGNVIGLWERSKR